MIAAVTRNLILANAAATALALMLLPYARIVPMHLTIILGSTLAGDSALALLLFASLKTGADVLMHHVEHRVLRRSAASAASVS